MTSKITNVTDEQIRAVRDKAWAASDTELHGACEFLLEIDRHHAGYLRTVLRALAEEQLAPGDAVTCLGDGDDVFTVEEIAADGMALLACSDGTIHGWEETRKLTKKGLEPGPGIVALSEAEVAGFLTDSNWGED